MQTEEELKMRYLASIQEISATKPIDGADAIELVLIRGWQCVSKKGEFQKGDLCVYFRRHPRFNSVVKSR